MKLKILITGFLFCSFSGLIKAQLSESDRFEISKYLDIYNALSKELFFNYVDSINIKETVQTNIYSMLKRLDPYTEYIPDEEMQDFQFQTTGEYGGIGSVISSKENKITIIDPYEGMPAALAGLQPGDIVGEIDGEKMEGQPVSYASEKLKGQPNTPVKIKIQRGKEKKLREFSIERKRIHIDPVNYYGVLKDGIGYISLSGFTVQSAQTVKVALNDLLVNQHVGSIIFDVRDNGGGIVDECLDMLNFFINKGEILLSMRGKNKLSDRTYRATQMPLAPDIPLVILVNHNSASASEILSGTIQDLDRGVIVGTRTYGKGLVQSTRPLPYDGRLKLTTAKYYIPSGRSIQAIDYAHRNEDGSVLSIPDSLTSIFYTSKGRIVKDGGGILPDFVVEDEKIPTIVYYMEAKYVFFDFVAQWREKHPEIAAPSEFTLTDDIYDEFKEFVKSKDFTYDIQSEKVMKTLKDVMEFEGYTKTAQTEFQALEEKLKPDLNRDLELHKKLISRYLSLQIMKQYYYARGQLIYELRDDRVLDKAIEVILDKELYNKTINAEQ
jgi:carboxyl-terminal processing protease